MKLTRKEIYQAITNQLLEKLSQGTIPWRKSWKVGLPANLQTKRIYSGINFLNLCMSEYPSPYYLTFLQCVRDRGGQVNRGEKGSWVIYWDVKKIHGDEADNEQRGIPFIRRSIVFNIAQTSLFESENEARLIVECEEVVNGFINPPKIRHNTIKAFYSPEEDYISLPPINSFTTEAEYYSTLMHELVHSTGHSSRLNRPLMDFEKDNYSFEELVAEIGSTYLSAMTGIAPKTIDNQAAYIQGWMKLAESREFVFMKAAVEAQKAVNLILASPEKNSNNSIRLS